MSWLDEIRFDDNGLVPAIAQDAGSGKILMIAWMNRESLQLTADKKEAVYWSRSRGKLWHKGEESGHTQKIVDIRFDCDEDVILLKVEQCGGIACHTGRESCFYRQLQGDQWVEVEQEINRRSGLNAAVYNVAGVRITDFKKWANQFCPALRATEKGQEYICAVAHQNIAAQAIKTGKTIVNECDAGLMKFAVPIFVENEFLGVAGGCGLLRDRQQVDTYLVHRTTGMAEEDVEGLSKNIATIPNYRLESTISYVENKVAEIIREFGTIAQIAN